MYKKKYEADDVSGLMCVMMVIRRYGADKMRYGHVKGSGESESDERSAASG